MTPEIGSLHDISDEDLLRNIALRCRNHNQYEAAQEFPLVVRERCSTYVVGRAHPARGNHEYFALQWSRTDQPGSNRVTLPSVWIPTAAPAASDICGAPERGAR
jgi:hypothetical protein